MRLLSLSLSSSALSLVLCSFAALEISQQCAITWKWWYTSDRSLAPSSPIPWEILSLVINFETLEIELREQYFLYLLHNCGCLSLGWMVITEAGSTSRAMKAWDLKVCFNTVFLRASLGKGRLVGNFLYRTNVVQWKSKEIYQWTAMGRIWPIMKLLKFLCPLHIPTER